MTCSKKLLLFVLASLLGPTAAAAQSHSETAPLVAFCDPLESAGEQDYEDDRDDEEELTEIRRYDLEKSERLTTRQEIMNAIFEEKWNFETQEPIDRYELCSAEPSYILLWSKLMRELEDGGLETDAEAYMSIRKDGSFELVYARRPYVGTWELEGTDMILTAEWLNNGQPYRTPVERVETPVETTDGDGNQESFDEETYRLGAFRFYRLPTTVKGTLRDCSCANSAK